MAHSTQQGFFVSMSTRGYSRSARAAEEGVALGQEALQAMLEHRPVDLRKDVGNDRPGDARRGGCGGANREGLVRLEDGHRASSLPRRWSLPCGPARRKEQIREGVVMQFGFFNHAESLGYDSVWVTDSQMIFSDCYAVLALAARQTRRIRLGPGTAICGTRIPPVHVAAMATLNRLAPGRVHLGIGTGNTAMRTMGQRPMRIAEYDEYLRVLAALLRGETVDYRYHDRVRPISPSSRRSRSTSRASARARWSWPASTATGSSSPSRPAAAQEGVEAAIAVVAVRDREALKHVTQVGLLTPGSHAPPVPVIARAADPRQRAHPLDGEGALRGHHRVDEREDALPPRPPLGQGGSLTCRKASLKKSSSTACWPTLRSSSTSRESRTGSLLPTPYRRAWRLGCCTSARRRAHDTAFRGRPRGKSASAPPCS